MVEIKYIGSIGFSNFTHLVYNLKNMLTKEVGHERRRSVIKDESAALEEGHGDVAFRIR